jgi:hypothetical protein
MRQRQHGWWMLHIGWVSPSRGCTKRNRGQRLNTAHKPREGALWETVNLNAISCCGGARDKVRTGECEWLFAFISTQPNLSTTKMATSENYF